MENLFKSGMECRSLSFNRFLLLIICLSLYIIYKMYKFIEIYNYHFEVWNNMSILWFEWLISFASIVSRKNKVSLALSALLFLLLMNCKQGRGYFRRDEKCAYRMYSHLCTLIRSRMTLLCVEADEKNIHASSTLYELCNTLLYHAY